MKTSIGYYTGERIIDGAPEDVCAALKQAGFEGVDFDFDSYFQAGTLFSEETEAQIIKIADAVRAAGLGFAQSHLPFLGGHLTLGDGSYEAFREAYVPGCIRSIELCGKIGCPSTVIHLFLHPDLAYTFESNVKMISELLAHLEKHNVKLAIENIFSGGDKYIPCGVTTADDIMGYINYFHSPYVGACLDTGHAFCTRNNAVEMARTFGDSLFALHIHASSRRDIHALPFMLPYWVDYTDYAELSRVLKAIGYKGYYNMEVLSTPLYKQLGAGMDFLNLSGKIARYLADFAS